MSEWTVKRQREVESVRVGGFPHARAKPALNCRLVGWAEEGLMRQAF